MTTSQVTTSHTKKYELTHFARYLLVWFCDLGRISSIGLARERIFLLSGLAEPFMFATLILSFVSLRQAI